MKINGIEVDKEWEKGFRDGVSYGKKNYEFDEHGTLLRKLPEGIYEKENIYKNGFFEGLITANAYLFEKHKIIGILDRKKTFLERILFKKAKHIRE